MTEGNGNGAPVKLARKDFQSDQEVRWCPGCGDYGILTAVQFFLPETGIKPEELVFVSGIGCAARLPYYMNTYGIHGIHGRAPAIATGVALAIIPTSRRATRLLKKASAAGRTGKCSARQAARAAPF